MADTLGKLEERDTAKTSRAAQQVMSPGTLGDTPPMESNPSLRRTPTMSEVLLPDEETDQQDRRFTDLMADIPIGNGQFFITVERLEPKIWEGTPARGELPPICYPMTWDQFVETYGGTKYELIPYGPAHPKAKDPSRPRRWAKPIIVHVPECSPVFSVEPFEPEHVNNGKSNGKPAMTLSHMPNRRPASNADARIFETDLEHQRLQEDRREQRERQAEERGRRERERELQRVQQESGVAMQLLQSQLQEKSGEIQRLTKTLDDLRDKLTENRKPDDVEKAVRVAEAMKPNPEDARALRETQERLSAQHKEELNRINAAHSEELRRIIESKATEIQRLTEQHNAEQKSLRDQHAGELKRLDERIQAAEKSANERVAAAESRATERVNEAQRRIEKMEETARAALTDAKADGDRRVADIQAQHAARITDIDRQHKRDMDGIRERGDILASNERSAMQSQIAIKDQEIARLKEELERVREEANKPLTERINEVAATAEVLGFSRDTGGGEQDWRSIALQVGGNIAQNLPDILRSAGDTVGRIRQQQPGLPAQSPPTQLAPPMQHPALPGFGVGGFATDDGPEFEGPRGSRPPIRRGVPTQTPPVHAPAPQPQPQLQPQQVQQVPQPQQQVAQQMPNPAPAPARAPAQQLQPATPTQPQMRAAVPQQPDPVIDQQIIELMPLFEGAYSQKQTPQDLADFCVKQFGKATCSAVIGMGISPERIIMVLQRNGQAANPLCRRDGQKYLRETFAELQKMVAA